MARFNDLPPELRFKIWKFCLPEARALQVIRHDTTQRGKNALGRIKSVFRDVWQAPKQPRFKISSASYGLHHPITLSINHESRSEALKVLTKHMDVYWNLEIDAPYFEAKGRDPALALIMTGMHDAGLLEPFRNIAIDSTIWTWGLTDNLSSYFGKTMMMPRSIMVHMPHLKRVFLTYTLHVNQHDLVTPYRPWIMGELNANVALTADFQKKWCYQNIVSDYQRQPYFVLNSTDHQIVDYEWNVMGVHNRERDGDPSAFTYTEEQWPARPPYYPHRGGRGCT